jgi:hypothetical protein
VLVEQGCDYTLSLTVAVSYTSRYIGVMTLLAVNTTEQERPTYIGMTGLVWGIGTVLGPVSSFGRLQVEPFSIAVIN